MRRVVQTEVDSILAADPAERRDQLELLRAAFIPWLATIDPDNDQPMRRRARWTDLPEASRPLIDAMVDKRLLVNDTRDGQVVVEVALESLLRQWDELAGWLREQRQNLKAADDLHRTAAAWRASDRDPAWLLTGTRLADAETLAAKPGFHDRLDPTRDFLHASRQPKTSASTPRNTARAELRRAGQTGDGRSARGGAAETLPHPARCLAVMLVIAVVAGPALRAGHYSPS